MVAINPSSYLKITYQCFDHVDVIWPQSARIHTHQGLFNRTRNFRRETKVEVCVRERERWKIIEIYIRNDSMIRNKYVSFLKSPKTNHISYFIKYKIFYEYMTMVGAWCLVYSALEFGVFAMCDAKF